MTDVLDVLVLSCDGDHDGFHQDLKGPRHMNLTSPKATLLAL